MKRVKALDDLGWEAFYWSSPDTVDGKSAGYNVGSHHYAGLYRYGWK